mmetsp:Transcript_24198/g.53309  ORF Transcript_24198/g.53309 Transcript_24198/m.53309 type:complete len:167 (+) Transcript_24198:403-903(+)
MAECAGRRALGILCDPGLFRQEGYLRRDHVVRAPSSRLADDARLFHYGGRDAPGSGQTNRDPEKESGKEKRKTPGKNEQARLACLVAAVAKRVGKQNQHTGEGFFFFRAAVSLTDSEGTAVMLCGILSNGTMNMAVASARWTQTNALPGTDIYPIYATEVAHAYIA